MFLANGRRKSIMSYFVFSDTHHMQVARLLVTETWLYGLQRQKTELRQAFAVFDWQNLGTLDGFLFMTVCHVFLQQFSSLWTADCCFRSFTLLNKKKCMRTLGDLSNLWTSILSCLMCRHLSFAYSNLVQYLTSWKHTAFSQYSIIRLNVDQRR